MSLSDWLRYGWLVEHEPSAGEMIALAREISETVRRWLADERPDLL